MAARIPVRPVGYWGRLGRASLCQESSWIRSYSCCRRRSVTVIAIVIVVVIVVVTDPIIVTVTVTVALQLSSLIHTVTLFVFMSVSVRNRTSAYTDCLCSNMTSVAYPLGKRYGGTW